MAHHFLPVTALRWTGFVLLLQLSGCSEDARAPNVGAGGSTSAEPYPYYEDTRETPVNDLAWSRCDLITESGTVPNAAECATFEVPARRNVAGTKPVTLSIKRYRPVASPRGQLWLINGGPGAGTAELEAAIALFTAVGRDLEVYLLDHRGTGSSSPLHCPAEEASTSTSGTVIRGDEWATCAAELSNTWGDDLAGFNVTEAATDLGETIARTRHGSEAVFLYSVSYGTYLAERYLQLFGDQATGVVLDSICSPGSCQLLLNYDRAFDTTVRKVMALCAADSTCSEQLGSDPYAQLVAVANSLDSGHCSELGWTRSNLRQIMGFMVMSVGLRDYLPAVVKRLQRCSTNDVASLKHFAALLGSVDTEAPSFSQALSANIVLAELSESPLPTESDIAASIDGLYASLDSGARMAGAINRWPIYTPDDFFGKFAETATPLLMLNGDLDPQTPLEVALPSGEHFTGAYQHFIEIPYAAHTTLTQSPIDAEYHTCGAALIRQFFDDPRAELDDSCLELVLPLAFSGDTTGAQALFGTGLAWDDVALTSTENLDATRLSSLKARLLNSPFVSR